MRILLQSRADLKIKPGGDTHQMTNIKQWLEKLNVNCNISTEPKPRLKGYDIIHIFNITRPYESYIQINNAKQQNKKIVFTPLYQRFDEWDKKGRLGLQKLFCQVIQDRDKKEFIKNSIRFIDNNNILRVVLKNKYTALQKQIIKISDMLIVNSEMEMQTLKNDFHINKKYSVVYNGVDELFMRASAKPFINKYKLKNFVLCVANFSSIKNHLNLIRALTDTTLPLILIGNTVKFHNHYFRLVQKEAKKHPRAMVLQGLDRKMIASAYAAAKVHVLPSWFENAPLVNLEAAFAGCNIVSTSRGYAREYLKDMAWYCDPDSKQSIKNAIISAYRAPRSITLKNYILKYYTWKDTARQILEAYHAVLQ